MKTVKFQDLADLIGEKNAVRVCKHFAELLIPSPLQVLRAKRDYAIFKEWDDGVTVSELSAKYSLAPHVIRAKVTKMLKSRTHRLKEDT